MQTPIIKASHTSSIRVRARFLEPMPWPSSPHSSRSSSVTGTKKGSTWHSICGPSALAFLAPHARLLKPHCSSRPGAGMVPTWPSIQQSVRLSSSPLWTYAPLSTAFAAQSISRKTVAAGRTWTRCCVHAESWGDLQALPVGQHERGGSCPRRLAPHVIHKAKAGLHPRTWLGGSAAGTHCCWSCCQGCQSVLPVCHTLDGTALLCRLSLGLD